MRTKNSKIVKKEVDKEFETYITSIYDFFSYEENGKPKDSLVFLKYSNFDIVVDSFFSELCIYLRNTNEFNSIKTHNKFDICVMDFFKQASLTKGEISKKLKNHYNEIKEINEYEFNTLIENIKNIKLHYKNKYIALYTRIRNNLAKDLILENDIHICPYCKRNYINVVTSINDKNFVIKPDLDHFYDKATYIFLASTIENLVPSCNICNSKLKSTEDFKEKKHLHPLVDNDLFEKIKFNYIGTNNTIYIENKNTIELDDIDRNSVNTFKIEEIYNTHKEILFNIKNKYKHYNKVKRNNLKDILPELSEQKILETIFYEYYHFDKKKESMYKMKKDLFDLIVKK